MVVPGRHMRWMLPAFMSLAGLLSACVEVPIDEGRTAIKTDSVIGIWEPPGRGDTAVPTRSSTVPVNLGRTVVLRYLRYDSTEPRRQRLESVSFRASHVEIEVDTLFNGTRRSEHAHIRIGVMMPERVRSLSVTDETNILVRLKQFELTIPRLDLSRIGSEMEIHEELEHPSAPGASITYWRNESKTLETRGDSRGQLKLVRVDYRRREMLLNVVVIFYLPEFGRAPHRLPLSFDFLLSY